MSTTSSTVEALAVKRDLSVSDVTDLASAVRGSTPERNALAALDRDFEKRVAPELPQSEHSLRKAMFSWMLDRADEARAALSRFSNPLAAFMLGRIAEAEEGHAEAAEQYKEAARELGDPHATLAWVNALRLQGDIKEVEKQLAKLEKKHSKAGPAQVRAEILCQRGRLLELDADPEGALDLYDQALETDPEHTGSAFRMGVIFDLRGYDDRAIDYYGRCAAGSQLYTGAMMTLALLYEDRGEYEHAIACYRDVLRAEPANTRAQLFLGGAIESTEQVYDEIERKEKEKLDQMLRLPVGEFELSVRSRNVLQKMDIHSLADLVQKSESEMLAYKNFGETSLREIKQLLSAKGLRLGMGRKEVQRRHQRERLALVMSDQDSRMLSMSISELDLSVRSRRCMARLNIRTVGDLITRTEEELLATKNFGQTSLTEIRSKLVDLGLRLRSTKKEAATS